MLIQAWDFFIVVATTTSSIATNVFLYALLFLCPLYFTQK